MAGPAINWRNAAGGLPVSWPAARDLRRLAGKAVRLLFSLRDSKLYAFGFLGAECAVDAGVRGVRLTGRGPICA